MSDNQPSPDPVSTPAGIPAIYFDGKTSAQHEVALRVVDHHLVLAGDCGLISVAVSDTRLTETSQHGPLLLSFANGGHCELPSSAVALEQLRSAGVALAPSFSFVSMLERDWRLVMLSIAFLAAAVAAFYIWLLPEAAGMGAQLVPLSVSQRIGRTVLVQLEQQQLRSSRLDGAMQDRINTRFSQLVSPGGTMQQEYKLLIRAWPDMPNAFALPGNFVVLTDDLVTLVDGDLDTLSGVLAHELGHLSHNHGLRTLIQAVALASVGSALIGDYSSLLAAIPATLGQLKYSRAFEAEADLEAHMLLCILRIDPAKTALFFDKAAAGPGKIAEMLPDYVKTHPSSLKRAEYFRTPC